MSQEYKSPEETGVFSKKIVKVNRYINSWSPFPRIENPFSRIAISSLDLNRSFSRIAIRSLDFKIQHLEGTNCNPRERNVYSRERITSPWKRITIP